MSCEEPVELDIDDAETKLVVNCHFTPDESFEVLISRSVFPDSDIFPEYPDNAEIQIYRGNEVLETLWPVNIAPRFPFIAYQTKNLKTNAKSY